MGESQELSPAAVDSVSLERALQDVEAANLRVIELAKQLLDSEERSEKLVDEIVTLKRAMDPRRKMEHVFRKNHTIYVMARRAKRMMGQ